MLTLVICFLLLLPTLALLLVVLFRSQVWNQRDRVWERRDARRRHLVMIDPQTGKEVTPEQLDRWLLSPPGTPFPGSHASFDIARKPPEL